MRKEEKRGGGEAVCTHVCIRNAKALKKGDGSLIQTHQCSRVHCFRVHGWTFSAPVFHLGSAERDPQALCDPCRRRAAVIRMVARYLLKGLVMHSLLFHKKKK